MIETSPNDGLDSGLDGLINAAIRLKQVFDPERPANPAPAPQPAPAAAAAAPWYQQPLVLVAAAAALVLAVVLVNRK